MWDYKCLVIFWLDLQRLNFWRLFPWVIIDSTTRATPNSTHDQVLNTTPLSNILIEYETYSFVAKILIKKREKKKGKVWADHVCMCLCSNGPDLQLTSWIQCPLIFTYIKLSWSPSLIIYFGCSFLGLNDQFIIKYLRIEMTLGLVIRHLLWYDLQLQILDIGCTIRSHFESSGPTKLYM